MMMRINIMLGKKIGYPKICMKHPNY
jgi:hypothetical protein